MSQSYFTKEQDQEIIKLYTAKPYKPGSIKELAAKYKIETCKIYKRAETLKLPRIKIRKPCAYGKRNWTFEEMNIVENSESLTNRQLQKKLSEEGFIRTVGAIDIFRRSKGWTDRQSRDETNVGYTTLQLEKVLGINDSTINRWINSGKLKSYLNGDPFRRVKREWIFEFMMKNPTSWKMFKVDSYWFIDLIIEQSSKFIKSNRSNYG